MCFRSYSTPNLYRILTYSTHTIFTYYLHILSSHTIIYTLHKSSHTLYTKSSHTPHMLSLLSSLKESEKTYYKNKNIDDQELFASSTRSKETIGRNGVYLLRTHSHPILLLWVRDSIHPSWIDMERCIYLERLPWQREELSLWRANSWIRCQILHRRISIVWSIPCGFARLSASLPYNMSKKLHNSSAEFYCIASELVKWYPFSVLIFGLFFSFFFIIY